MDNLANGRRLCFTLRPLNWGTIHLTHVTLTYLTELDGIPISIKRGPFFSKKNPFHTKGGKFHV